MDEINRGLLEKAERKFRAITNNPSRTVDDQDIDWKLVKEQLHRLDSALEADDVIVFNEALLKVLKRLSPPIEFRGRIGPDSEDESQSVPEPVWELLNHIVDRIHHKLALSSESQSGLSGNSPDEDSNTPPEE